MKKNIFTMGFLSLSLMLQAQTKSYSGDAYYGDIFGSVYGTETYTYVTNQYGEKIPDGTYSFSGKKTWSTSSVKVIGTYNLSVGMKNGKFNGQFTQSANYSGKLWEHFQWNQSNTSSKCNGIFLNGKPNGLFTCTIEKNKKCTATLKNGMYTGTYSYEGYSDGLPIEYSGSLTSSGKLTGQWIHKYYNGKHVYNFQNDVLISADYGDYTTSLALQELSKKFASGSITEKELEAQGVVIETDSLPLDVIFDILFEDEVGLYKLKKQTKGADFSEFGTKKYKKLKQINFLTDEGFEILLKQRKVWGGRRIEINEDGIRGTSTGLGYAFSNKDATYNLCKVETYGSFYTKYTIEHRKDDSEHTAYLTHKQEAILDSIYRAEAYDFYLLYKSKQPRELLQSYIKRDSTKYMAILNELSLESLNKLQNTFQLKEIMENEGEYSFDERESRARSVNQFFSADRSYILIDENIPVKNSYEQKNSLVILIGQLINKNNSILKEIEQKDQSIAANYQNCKNIVKVYHNYIVAQNIINATNIATTFGDDLKALFSFSNETNSDDETNSSDKAKAKNTNYNNLLQILDIQEKINTAISSENATQLDKQVKKSKDKSLETVLKIIEQ